MNNRIIFTGLITILSIIFCFGQTTYSKIYNLEVGWGNLATNFIQTNDGYIISLRFACYTDTMDCSSIAQFNNKGDLIDNIVKESFYFGNNDAMLINNGVIIGSGHWRNEGFVTQDILIGEYPIQTVNVTKYLNEDGFHYWNNGILKHQGNYYTYGDTKKEGTGRTGTIYASIVKWDSTASKVLAKWKYRMKDGYENHCYNLQAKPDGNLVFMNEVTREERPRRFHVITTIDTTGKIIDTIEMKDLRPDGTPRLLLDKSENYYFSSTKDPRERFSISVGAINKLNEDSLEWHVVLPYDNITNPRVYFINDFYEAANGDILACGSVWDTDVNDSLGDFVGFTTRVSPEGDILWLRLYKLSNELYPRTEAYYRPSFLKQIEETKNGEILCIGGSNQRELDGSITQELWILSTDQNGCVEGYDCDSVVILGPPQEDYHPFVDTSHRWHRLLYLRADRKTIKYRISKDSVLIGNHYYHNMLSSFQKIGEEWEQTDDFLREDGQKVWVNRNGEDFLLYDFGLNITDTFRSDINPDGIGETVLIVENIDSVILIDGSKRKRLSLRCAYLDWDIVAYWIEGIGDLWGPFAVEWSCIIDGLVGHLSCFYKDNELFWHNDRDTSCFVWTGIYNADLINNQINVFPNPTNNNLYIDTDLIIKEVIVLDQMSKVVNAKRVVKSIDLSELKSGVYFLKIKLDNDDLIYKKIVKY